MARDASRIRGILRRFLESVTNCRSRLDNVLAKTIYARTASGWAVGAAGLGQRAGRVPVKYYSLARYIYIIYI